MLFPKIVQMTIKLYSRSMDYMRGLALFFVVVSCGGKCRGIPRVGKCVVFKYPPHIGVYIGKKCDIGPFCIFDIPPDGTINIGNNVKFTAGVVLSSITKLTIGDGCLFAEWVSIRDAQHEFKSESPIRLQGLSSAPISIEADVWIGRSSVVLSGAYIEKGCIVGANSLVKKGTLLSNGIYAGIPLKMLGQRT